MSRLLINEEPLIILPMLAKAIGLNEAIVLQQMHYWIDINLKADKNFVDGYYWTYNTYEEWTKQFPFWSRNTIVRTIDSLRKMNLLVAENHNKMKADKTLWYRINHKVLDSIETEVFQAFAQNGQIKKKDKSKQNQAFAQNGQMDLPNLGKAIPETNQRLTEEEDDDSQQLEVRLPEIVKLIEPEWVKDVIIDIWENGVKGYDDSIVKQKIQQLTQEHVNNTLEQYNNATGVKIPYLYFKSVLWRNLSGTSIPKPKGTSKSSKDTSKNSKDTSKSSKGTSRNPVPQTMNYEQREYDEEYLNSFYANANWFPDKK